MRNGLILLSIVSLITNCSSPMRTLKKYGNSSYSYSLIANSKIGFCVPLVKNASIQYYDNSDIFKPDSMHDDEANEIKSSFYAHLKIAIASRSLSWQLFDNTLNNRLHTIKISDSIKTFTMPSDLKSSLLDSKIDNLILIYDIASIHDQQVTVISSGDINNSINYQASRIKIKFNYKCAILDLKNDKLLMNVKMHESGSSPLNFYDGVCEKLFDILLYGKAE